MSYTKIHDKKIGSVHNDPNQDKTSRRWKDSNSARVSSSARWDFDEDRRDMRHAHTVRQRVIHQRSCEQLAVFVVDKALEERPAKALRDAALNLSLDLRWIDSKTHVLYSNVIQHAHLTRAGINGYLRHVHGKHR